jgi:purine-nucleoside phosphorylase
LKKKDKEFSVLFGVEPAQIKADCILMPMIPKGALSWSGLKSLSKGRLFHAASSENFTLIHTGIGASFAGDAVLYLKDTGCRNLFLFGSCGLVKETKELNIASQVIPFKCFPYESFSEILSGKALRQKACYPDIVLYKNFSRVAESRDVKKVICATLGSLKLEQEMTATFEKSKIEVVDMECSAFFSAADHCGIRAMALFYVSDIIKEKPFYEEPSQDLKSRLSLSIKNSFDLLCEFIEKNQTG